MRFVTITKTHAKVLFHSVMLECALSILGPMPGPRETILKGSRLKHEELSSLHSLHGYLIISYVHVFYSVPPVRFKDLLISLGFRFSRSLLPVPVYYSRSCPPSLVRSSTGIAPYITAIGLAPRPLTRHRFQELVVPVRLIVVDWHN